MLCYDNIQNTDELELKESIFPQKPCLWEITAQRRAPCLIMGQNQRISQLLLDFSIGLDCQSQGITGHKVCWMSDL